MKKTIQLVVVFFALASSSMYGQQFTSSNSGTDVRLNLYSAYSFQDSFDSYYSGGNYSGKIQDGLQYGGGIEYIVGSGTGVELSYTGQTTNVKTNYYYTNAFNNKTIDYDAQVNYIMLGGNKYFRQAGSKLEGFGGISLGVNIVDLNNTNAATNKQYPSQTFTRFAWGVKAGGVYWVSDKVGIKMQAQLLSTSQAFGGGFYVGSGSGAAISSYSTIYQFSLGGGLVFQLSK